MKPLAREPKTHFTPSRHLESLVCFCWRSDVAVLRRFVQFFLRLGCGKAAPDPRSQPVLLQFSVDGGLSWGLLQEFLFSNSSNQARLVALEIPLRARTTSTRIRWWQPSEDGHFYSPWVIDQVLQWDLLYAVHSANMQ